MPDAPDSGAVVTLVAEHSRWEPDTLAVPAAASWQLVLDNHDKAFHDFLVRSPDLPSTRLASKFSGPNTMTFKIPGLPAGTYEFVCTIHADTMRGVLVVGP
jgi:plastocyanin